MKSCIKSEYEACFTEDEVSKLHRSSVDHDFVIARCVYGDGDGIKKRLHAGYLNIQEIILPSKLVHRLPRFSCSLSMASKRLLKFPAPNPEKLLRWIISMKTVGRSSNGLVKSCSK